MWCRRIGAADGASRDAATREQLRTAHCCRLALRRPRPVPSTDDWRLTGATMNPPTAIHSTHSLIVSINLRSIYLRMSSGSILFGDPPTQPDRRRRIAIRNGHYSSKLYVMHSVWQPLCGFYPKSPEIHRFPYFYTRVYLSFLYFHC